MGYEAACTLRVGKTTVSGKAFLEQHELVFRGPTRLAIPLKDVVSAVSHDGVLTVRFGRTVAAFELGTVARRWADRITSPPSRLDKLGVKAGTLVRIVGQMEKEFSEEIAARGARVVRATPSTGTDIVFYRADTRGALPRIAELKTWLKPDGALWVIRPKGSDAISESDVMSAGKRFGLVDVKVASFSSTHTAEKFVIPRANR